MATFIQGNRTSYDTTTETRNVRDVSQRIFRYLDHSLLYFKGGTTIGQRLNYRQFWLILNRSPL